MGEYEDNHEVGDHIWNALVHGNDNNNNRPVERIYNQQDNILQLQVD